MVLDLCTATTDLCAVSMRLHTFNGRWDVEYTVRLERGHWIRVFENERYTSFLGHEQGLYWAWEAPRD